MLTKKKKEEKMKKIVLILLAMLFTASLAFGSYVEIGTGTGYTPSYGPFYNYYENNKTQTLYLQSELGSAMTITQISFNIEQVATTQRDLVNFTINFLHTDDTAFTPGSYHDMTGATQVFFSNPYTLATSTGWTDIDITDFAYNGTQNLIVEVIWGDQGGYTSTYYRNYKTSSSGTCRMLYGYSDSQTPPSYDGSAEYFSNMRFHYSTLHDFATLDHAEDSRSMQDTTVLINENVTFHIVAKNFGTTTESSPIKWTCTGGTPTSDTDESTGSLAQDATEHHIFSPTWSASTAGTYTVKFYTDLATDTDHSNDTTTVVITVCAPQTPPVTQNFDGVTAPDIPDCWSVENTNGDANAWETYAGYYRSSPNCMRIRYNVTQAMDDWFFSCPLNLIGGTQYKVTFWYRAYNSSNEEKIEVKWGTSASSAGMTQGPIFADTTTSTSYIEGEGTFTPGSNGTYYVGWHGYSDANKYYLYVDDIEIKAITGPGEPTSPNPSDNAAGVAINNDPDISWTNPSAKGVPTYNEVYFDTSETKVTNKDVSVRVLNGSPSTVYSQYNQATNLLFGEDYYWRILEYDASKGVTDGPVWHFTTENGKATNPDPVDGATNVAVTYTTLDWDDVTGATGYKISIGTTPGGTDIQNKYDCGTTSSYTHSTNWTYAQHIYWTVYTENGAQEVTGDEWDFTVEHDPSKLWESFEGTTFPPVGWTQKNLGDNTSGVTWARTTLSTYYHTSPAGAYCSWGASGEAQDEWLITPKLEVRTGDKDFSFWYKTSSSFTGTVKVRLSTTNTDTASFSNTLFTLGTQSTWLKKESDLTSFIGNDVYIAFQYLGTYDYPAAIDDVEGPTLFVGPPGVPTNPNPGNGDTDVSNTADLGWTNGYQTDNIDLYFSTDSSKVANKDGSVRVITGQNVETYDPGTMAYSTKYFWKVICKNSAKAETDGPLWKFTVQDDPNYGQGTGTPLYYFANSLATSAPSHPSYSWIDISGTGTDVIGTVDGDSKVGGPYSIGFDFNFFGTNYNQFWIAADGYICFSPITSSEFTNQHIPSTSGVGNIVALFWDDMDPGDTDVLDRHIYYGTSGGNMVITYLHLPEYWADTNGWITAQIILKPNGNIKLQYKEHGSSIDLNGATIGIENSAEDAGVEYRYNTDGGPIFGSPLAVEFGTNENTLPVVLSDFTVQINLNSVPLISWSTSSETDILGWNIYRSENDNLDQSFQINTELIPGAGTTSEPTEYTFEDEYVVYENTTYWYWLESIEYSGITTIYEPTYLTVPEGGGEPQPPEIPFEYGLHQNYPNPFNANTVISFVMKEDCIGELSIYNIKGQKVKTLFSNKPISKDELIRTTWDIKDETGKVVSPGIYFMKLETNTYTSTKKIMILK